MNPLIIFLITTASRGDTGIWRSFVNFLSSIIEFIYKLIPSYGVAIILFTIITRLALLPLDLKSKRASKQMNELQPELNKINEKYKDDKES